ncbi:glycosyltransferase [Microbacterium sp. 179-I 3D4 NHS]|uniref:glycosyltransferase n=1 Tax=Microbacterium sp. 179-I 3D4 NHS TaxID=3142381 RepID=UPI0039A35059
MTLRVFVSVGTDHHPFGRLIDWIDLWVAEQPDVELVVQHGFSPASATGENHAMMTGEQLQAHYARADVVVAQVGPGTISDANRAGILPIVVPRDPSLGEVVDAHQFAFGDFMAARGRCTIVTTEADLRAALDRAASDAGANRFAGDPSGSDAASAVAALVAEIVSAPRRRLAWRRVSDMIRRPAPGSGHGSAS